MKLISPQIPIASPHSSLCTKPPLCFIDIHSSFPTLYATTVGGVLQSVVLALLSLFSRSSPPMFFLCSSIFTLRFILHLSFFVIYLLICSPSSRVNTLPFEANPNAIEEEEDSGSLEAVSHLQTTPFFNLWFFCLLLFKLQKPMHYPNLNILGLIRVESHNFPPKKDPNQQILISSDQSFSPTQLMSTLIPPIENVSNIFKLLLFEKI